MLCRWNIWLIQNLEDPVTEVLSVPLRVVRGDWMRIRVQIDPFNLLVCRKGRLNGAVLQIRPGKPRPHIRRCGTILIPFCSKALCAEHRPRFCSPLTLMVTSPYKLKILERDADKKADVAGLYWISFKVSTVVIITLFSITHYHWPNYAEWFVSYSLL
jgi:hypothetical protein